jgi:hypothetical protein
MVETASLKGLYGPGEVVWFIGNPHNPAPRHFFIQTIALRHKRRPEGFLVEQLRLLEPQA